MLSLPYNIEFQKTDYAPLIYKTISLSCVLFTLFYYNFVILNKIITFATDIIEYTSQLLEHKTNL